MAESDMGKLWEPRVIESGRETVGGFKEDEKGKRRASVLSSLSFSWFSVIHVFMSSVHALSSLVRLVTSLRGADFWSCVSSSKSWWFTEWLTMISERVGLFGFICKVYYFLFNGVVYLFVDGELRFEPSSLCLLTLLFQLTELLCNTAEPGRWLLVWTVQWQRGACLSRTEHRWLL